MRKRLVDQFFEEAKKRGVTMCSISKKSGLSESTLRSWRRHEPLLGNFVALVQALGGEVQITWEKKNKSKVD
jgi:lambda repressor-like predicted transcriptional regulator|tara:strand:+ start:7274 stop:7489 length:216 start_codon:yes stop_codon:yes gene_type:complete